MSDDKIDELSREMAGIQSDIKGMYKRFDRIEEQTKDTPTLVANVNSLTTRLERIEVWKDEHSESNFKSSKVITNEIKTEMEKGFSSIRADMSSTNKDLYEKINRVSADNFKTKGMGMIGLLIFGVATTILGYQYSKTEKNNEALIQDIAETSALHKQVDANSEKIDRLIQEFHGLRNLRNR